MVQAQHYILEKQAKPIWLGQTGQWHGLASTSRPKAGLSWLEPTLKSARCKSPDTLGSEGHTTDV